MTAINFDAATPSDLKSYASDASLSPKQRAYARAASEARKARLAGRIAIAMRLEERCEALYQQLPASLRW